MKLLTISLMAICLLSAAISAVPIQNLSDLVSIRVHERTGSLFSHNFAKNSSQMLTQLSGTLSSGNRDFSGTGDEHYDVFYSDSNGIFNANGEFVTVELNFSVPGGGGGNISGVELVFSSSTVFADTLASFVEINGNSSTLGNAVDGNLSTHTTLGDSASQRLRVTVGFFGGNAVPEANSFFLLFGSILFLFGYSKPKK